MTGRSALVVGAAVIGVVGCVAWLARAPVESGASGVSGGVSGSGSGTGTGTATGERRRANHLIRERSAYLRQHAYNPVRWYPWGKEALALAKKLGRPIFLSIGYASCHWCHVMEREVFEDAAVARYLNAHFVSIKVDREERPDLDAVYMEAVQMMRGSGGWPLSVFLLPDLRPFYGGTYIPRARFAALLRRVVTLFTKERHELEGSAARIFAAVTAAEREGDKAAAPVDPKVVERGVQALTGSVDPLWGGARGRMKFPTPPRWTLLLHAYRKTGDKAAGDAVKLTLDKMASGGMHDQIGGGFHRYSTDARWVVPHFEKMLYDNAQLALLYTEAARVFGSADYQRVARDTLDFLLRRMRDPRSGAFYASYDADSGGHEGTFYTWTAAQIRAAIPGADGAMVAKLLGVGVGTPNFEGKWIPTWRAELAGVGALAPRATFERHRAELRALRAKRVWPRLDKKVVTSWNALAIRALAAAARAFDEPRYLAQQGGDSPLGRPMRFYDGVRPSAQAVLLRAQLRAAALRGDEALRARVKRGLAAAAQRLAGHGAAQMPSWLDVLLLWRGPLYEVVIVGGKHGGALTRTVRQRFAPYAVTVTVAAGGASAALRRALPTTENKVARGGKPTAYVCVFGACKAPTTDAAVLRAALLRGWKH